MPAMSFNPIKVKNGFDVEGYDAYVNISLINVKIDDALKVSDFKYSLVL